MANFVEIDITTDPGQLKQDIYDAIQAIWPEWEPAEANLETQLIEGSVNQNVDLRDLASVTSEEIFRAYGTGVLGIPSLAAAPATVTTTWTAIDNAGYTIEAGTLVGIAASGSDIVAFTNLLAVTIPPGSTSIAGVELTAVVPGTIGNELTADPELIDARDFIASITLTDAETSGGVDEEDPSDYLDRLASELQLLTPRPILPHDFEVLAREVPGVARALAIDGFNPGDDTDGNERMIAIAMLDAEGAGVNGTIKTAVEDRLDGLREVNFIINAMDPNVTEVDVQVTAVRQDGFSDAAVQANIAQHLDVLLDPATFAQGRNDPDEWRRVNTLRLNEVISTATRAQGVDFVTLVKLRKHGVGSLAATDLVLDGPASVTTPGTYTISVSA